MRYILHILKKHQNKGYESTKHNAFVAKGDGAPMFATMPMDGTRQGAYNLMI